MSRQYYKAASYYNKDRAEGETNVSHAHNIARNSYAWDACNEEGAEFFTHDALCHGDYSGQGALGRANIKSLAEEYSALEGIVWERYYMAHGFEGVIIDANYKEPGAGAFSAAEEAGIYCEEWENLCESFARTIDALDDYPCIDEGAWSAQEFEEEQEAWERDGYSDLARAVRESYGTPDYDGWADDFDSSHAKQLCSDVVFGNMHGDECSHEQGGAWIDVAYVMKQHVTEENAEAAYRAVEAEKALAAEPTGAELDALTDEV